MNQETHGKILDITGVLKFSCPSCGTSIHVASRTAEEIAALKKVPLIRRCDPTDGAISNFHAIVC